MKHLFIIALLSTIIGCSVDNSGGVYDETQTVTASNGLVLKPSTEVYVSIEEMASFYNDIMSCMGMTAPPPTVQYVSYKDYFNGAYGAPWGGYISEGLVFVNSDSLGLGFQRDARIDKEILRHEFVHHVLDLNGADKSHSSPMFKTCNAVGVNTYN